MKNVKFRDILIGIFLIMATLPMAAQDNPANPYMKEIPEIPLIESDWEVGAGTLVVTNGYGILSASENAGGYLVARAYFKQVFSGFPRYEISVKFGRLDKDYGQPMEIFFLGGAFAIAEGGSFYFWEHDGGQFSGWKQSSAIQRGRLNTLKIRHIGREITGYINGEEVGRFQLKRPIGDKRISIYMKGRLNGEPTMVFSNFTLTKIVPESELDSETETETETETNNQE